MSDDDKYEYIDKIMDEYYTESSYAECIAQYPNELEICDIYNFRVNGGNKKYKNNKKIVKTSTREKKHTNRKKYTKKNKKKNNKSEKYTKRNKYKEK